MKIIAVIVTHNRIELLSRALNSVSQQSRKADTVFVISNSTDDNFIKENEVCTELGFKLIKNYRTQNYAGALNTAVAEIIKENGISDNLYFASLDDDDEWLPDYLSEIGNTNTSNYELIAANILRSSETENEILILPQKLSAKDFIIGNPGISGSNTFIKLITLLKAGAFDEGLAATIDRDFLVRVFLLNPNYKIINKHLVTQYTDTNRERVTTNYFKKKESLRVFFYKYQYLMNENDKECFFQRAEELFLVKRKEFEFTNQTSSEFSVGELLFEGKGNYQFIIGFITSNQTYTERILKQIIELKIPVDLLVIINNTKNNSLEKCTQILNNKITYRIVQSSEWKSNLKKEQYGSSFSSFTEINSIPLGRTILHYHLHNETIDYIQPVYWIIDDDITFNFISKSKEKKEVNLFKIIKENLNNVDAIIGSVSNDPPLPFLSSIRCQLVDFLHSHWAKNEVNSDFLNLRDKNDYYYDLSDQHSDHLEGPIYNSESNENAISAIFSGKSITRKVLQKSEINNINRVVSQRGPNTLVFNRDLLHYYPVINVSVNNKFARRGDLLWVLFNQIVSERNIVENTYSIQQNRSISTFDLRNEIEKSAYDIIGYAFNKGFLNTIQKIKTETNPNRPKDIFEKLETEDYFQILQSTYRHYLQNRKTKFLMNYYRIIGLLEILSHDFKTAKILHDTVSQNKELNIFHSLLANAENEETLKTFVNELKPAIWTYSNAITNSSESKEKHKVLLQDFFAIKVDLRHLGCGSEGIAFTDNTWVYKSFYNMTDKSWEFIKAKSINFSNSKLLEKIECFESDNCKFIKYPFHAFKPLEKINAHDMTDFMKFCRENQFVFTNIAPKNFIETLSGQIKLIDYGKSFEPYTEEKFINSIKRAYLLRQFPKMKDDDFRKLISIINAGETPNEISDWEEFHKIVMQ
jgi:hypothetical protein